MPTPTDTERATALVLEGWNHLQLQRPLAAWGSWQRALRVVPEFKPAVEALARLEAAADLPAAARASYRFRNPDPARRAAWDQQLRGEDLSELDRAAEAFASLSAADPDDAPAAFNHGLCLAWLGRNADAVAALDRATRLVAGAAPDHAVEAWTLAEVLRQGAGAEDLADDLNFTWTASWSPDRTASLLAAHPEIHPLPGLRDPVGGGDPFPDTRVFEWLDRPFPDPSTFEPEFDRVPRLLAAVVVTPQAIRLSSPDPRSLEEIQPALLEALGNSAATIRREAAPLPLPLLDAAVWTFRLPKGTDPEAERLVARLAVEHHYETRWIHLPRQGLGGLSPLAAGRRAQSGDALARVHLEAVVRLREQLGARAKTAALYNGYPFDRLRRRLGLKPEDPAAVDADDPACMSGDDLDVLDVATLDDVRLAEAYESASALGDDPRTARFAAELVRRGSPSLGRLAPGVIAPLVREALSAGLASEALDWLDRARPLNDGRDRPTFDVWAAEILARTGRPEAAVATYRSLLDARPDPRLALDAAETLLDNGADAQALLFLLEARDDARRLGDEFTLRKAEELLAAR